MRNHLFAVAFALLAPAGAALAYKGMAPPPPDAPQMPRAPAGEPASFAYLKSPLPGQPASCPEAKPADGLVRVPLFAPSSGSCPVAEAGGEVIPLADLLDALAEAHQSAGAEGARQDATAMVNRMVDAKLVAQEARAMGIDEIPDVAAGVEAIKRTAAREILKARVTQGVQPDPAEVDRLYKNAVREWKLRSVLFAQEADAKQMVAAVKGGASFDAAARKAVADKKARGGEAPSFVPASQLYAPVAAAASKLKVGGVSAPVKVSEGWAVLKLEAVRYPENATARTNAQLKSLKGQQEKALKKYYDEMARRYAKIDKKLLKSLDFQAPKPGFAAMAKDQRVVATVEGSTPITVADLAAALEKQFYHGIESAIREKKLNRQVEPTLDALVSPKLVAAESARQGILETAEYKGRVSSAADSFLFGAFVQRVLLPDIKVAEADARKYYDQHKKDFTYPAFLKVESIGFATSKDAQAAAEKLRAGTDFKWLNANADGKLPDDKATEAPPSMPIAVSAMKPAFAKAMQGAKRGDSRVFTATEGQHYAVHVIDEIPAREQPYEEARESIMQKLFGEAVTKSIQDWIGKLRKAHPVQVFLVRIGS